MTTAPLPNLVIAGVTKAGTTSLFHALAQHPSICASRVKEPAYFAPLRFGPAELAPLDSYRRFFSHCRDEPWRMEATTAYFYGGRRLIDAMCAVLDEPRVLIALRHPTERLWSEYLYLKSRTLLDTTVSFDAFVTRCEELRRLGADRTEQNRYYGALSTGFYVDYLSDWMDVFGERLRVVFFEQVVADPASAVGDICRWLGVDPDPVIDFDLTPRNEAVGHRSPLLQRAAYRVNDASRALWLACPRAHDVLRRMYGVVNGAARDQLALSPDARARVDELYDEANQTLAGELSARGYGVLPAWLEHGNLNRAGGRR